MKGILRALSVALAFLALSGPANAFLFGKPLPYKVEAGGNLYLRVHKNPYGAQPGGGGLGPWYLYWPLEAHFLPQAPAAYPNWPQPMTLPQSFHAPSPTPHPQFQPPRPSPGPQFQPPQPTPAPQFPPQPQPVPRFPPQPTPGPQFLPQPMGGPQFPMQPVQPPPGGGR